MTRKTKKKDLSNPVSTGGGGPRFENQVQTLFVVLEKDSLTKQGQKLEERRRQAVVAVYSRGGTPGVIEFAESVEVLPEE